MTEVNRRIYMDSIHRLLKSFICVYAYDFRLSHTRLELIIHYSRRGSRLEFHGITQIGVIGITGE